ncbi:dienelactone hydrolase family protein [bacterium]|nr:dienelactone hydrolase family protein [bacterium]
MTRRLFLIVILLFAIGRGIAGGSAESSFNTSLPPNTSDRISLPANEETVPAVIPPERLRGLTRDDWPQERAAIERRWLDFLGRFPERKPPLNAKVIGIEKEDEFIRRRITYEVEPGIPIEAYLLVPKGKDRPFPAMVVFHSTVDYTIRQPGGLEGPEAKHIGVHLAKRGYVALCPRNFIWDYAGLKWMDAVRKVKRDHPDWRGMAKMVWDGMRAVDYLCSLDYVDKNRIGCIGHSLGGKESLFLPAFDQRIKVAVSSEGGIGQKFSNWDAEWYLGPDIRKSDFPLRNHQVLALIAPRPFLLLGGNSADGDRSWDYILSVKPIYHFLGAGDGIAFFNHRQGHAYPPEAQQRAYEWIDRWLK